MSIKTVEFVGDRGQRVIVNPAAVSGIEEWPSKDGGQTQIFILGWGVIVSESIGSVKAKIYG